MPASAGAPSTTWRHEGARSAPSKRTSPRKSSITELFGGESVAQDTFVDPVEQRPERFSVGDKVDALVTNFDKKSRKIGLSIKPLEIAEEKEAVQQYGSSDSGASLGDILGAALAAKKDKE